MLPMLRLPAKTPFILPLILVGSAMAQTPTRYPNTPGYVKAKELSDGAVPSPKEAGNFIIGPTHNAAPEMSVRETVPPGQVFEFTMESKDSKIYPGIAREPGSRIQPDPTDPLKLIVSSRPTPYTRRVAAYAPKQYVAETKRHSSPAGMDRIAR